jgi:hypothetical protein
MIVVHDCADLHGGPYSILNDGAKRVGGSARGQRELVVSVGHALGSNEDEVKLGLWEEMGQLQPHIPRKRGLGAGSEDKQANRRGLYPQALDVLTAP